MLKSRFSPAGVVAAHSIASASNSAVTPCDSFFQVPAGLGNRVAGPRPPADRGIDADAGDEAVACPRRVPPDGFGPLRKAAAPSCRSHTKSTFGVRTCALADGRRICAKNDVVRAKPR